MKKALLILLIGLLGLANMIQAQDVRFQDILSDKNDRLESVDVNPLNQASFTKTVTAGDALISEDFESVSAGSLPQGWKKTTTAGNGWNTGTLSSSGTPLAGHSGTKYAFILSVQSSSNNSWLFSPSFDLVAGATYKVSFATFLAGYGGAFEKLAVKIGTAATADGMTHELYKKENVSQSGWTEEAILFTPTESGTYYLGFHGYSGAVNATMLDDVIVAEAFDIDAGVLSLDLTNVIPNTADYTISGKIKNYGISALTSCKINYQINDGAIQTYELTGINVASEKQLAFTHPTTVAPVVGSHTIKVWTSEPNGVEDMNEYNDAITFTYNIYDAENSFFLTPLLEGFTASTCGPCVGGNSNLKSVLNANTGSYTLIKYQMNWPGSGDPYYTAEGGVRRGVYDVNAVPYLALNGTNLMDTRNLTGPMLTNLQSNLTFIGIDAEYNVDGQTVTAVVTINPKASFEGSNIKLFMAIVEKTTTKNRGSNGETEFNQVMKKFMPDASGITIESLTTGVPVTITEEWEFKGDYRLPLNANNSIDHTKEHSVENFDNLEVIVWLQNMQTKEIYQSATAVLMQGNLPVTGVEISDEEIFIGLNNTYQLTANVKPGLALNKNVSWSSSHPDIASVDAEGLVTGKAFGETVITVTTEEGGFTDECKVTVYPAVESVSLNEEIIALTIGNTFQFIATVLPEDAYIKDVEWSLSPSGIVGQLTDNPGLVKGIKAGETTMTVTTVDGGHTASCIINVYPVAIDNVVKESLLGSVYAKDNSLYVDINTTGNVNIDLFDISGKKVSTNHVSVNGKTLIAIPVDSSRGVYLLRVTCDNETIVKKIVL